MSRLHYRGERSSTMNHLLHLLARPRPIAGSALVLGILSGLGCEPGDDADGECHDGSCAPFSDGNGTAPSGKPDDADDDGDDPTCPFVGDDECDEPEGTDLCAEGTDVADCSGGDSCEWTNDGECDEPGGTDLCPEGTDVADCSGGGQDSGDGDDPAAVADRVVGAWSVIGTVNTPDGPASLEIGWYVCADQRFAGYSEMNGWTFLDKGSYSVDEATEQVALTLWSKDTTLGDTFGPDALTLAYDESSDTLRFLNAFAGATMHRVEGSVTNADCEPSW